MGSPDSPDSPKVIQVVTSHTNASSSSDDDDDVSHTIISGAYDTAFDPETLMERKIEDQLRRGLSTRQISMLAIAGVIGTGLFLGTGKSLEKGGPASMLICYTIIGAVVYFVMLALGEMATYMPVAGSFCTYSTRFVDPAVGFALSWNYWANEAISVASDLTALQILFKYWTSFHSWIIALIFWIFVLVINLISVKAYGELEYWLALLKVATIFVFVIVGIVVNCGKNDEHKYLGFHYWHIDGAPFVNGFRGFASIFVTASFAYGGTESIGITAGETKNPHRTMPRVVRTVFWRIILFYLLTVLIIGIDVPWSWPNLDNGDTISSPFTIVFQRVGSKAGGSFMNAVIVTSVISACNHALYAGTRVMYTLSIEAYAPRFMSRLSRTGVPYVALLVTWAISGLCFGASFIGDGTLWTWLQSLIGVSNQISWLMIGITALRFRRGLKVQKKVSNLKYKNWTAAWGPWVVVIVVTFIILVQGWSSFSPWNTSSFFQSYVELGIMPVMILGWKLVKRTKFVRAAEMDLISDVYVDNKADDVENAYEDSLKGWRKWLFEVKSFLM